MATLSNPQRAAAWGETMGEMSRDNEACGVKKDDLRSAINAADDWVDANMVAFNLTLPILARTNLTQRQKTRILVKVLQKRLEGGG